MAGTNVQKLSQVPEEEIEYHIVIRVRSHPNFTVPVGRITAISKSGTTTATVTTDVPHGLNILDTVTIYGVRDQTNFANVTSQATITSIPSATTFTLVLGSAVTASSAGGAVWRQQANVNPTVFTSAIQSVTRTNNVLSAVANATWSTPIPGEYIYLYGLDGAPQVEGAYKVLRVNGATLELESPGPDFSLINTGGAGIRPTDLRLHFVRVMEYTRHVVEVAGGRGSSADINNSVPVAITGSATVNVAQSSGSTSNLWAASGYGGFLVADIASAAITSTSTSSAVIPNSFNNQMGTQAHAFSVIVTAVSGTNPTMDVVIQESSDNGTNWVDVYHFERINAVGQYVSPQIPATWGTRYRYIRTVGGTSPSFTNAINRIQFSHRAPLLRRFFDRTIVPNTLSSATPAYNVEGARHVQLTVVLTALTGAPSFQLQGSEDAVNWSAIGSPLAGIVGTATANFVDVLPKFVRAVVSVAGSGATLGYVCIKAAGPA